MRTSVLRLVAVLALIALTSCAKQPVISLRLRDSFPAGSLPGATLFAIDIYTDGRTSVVRYDGSRSEQSMSQRDLAALFAYFREQGAMGLTDTAIDAAIVREAQRSGYSNVYWVAVTHQPYTELNIRQSSNFTSVLRYSLPDQIRCQPNVTELHALQRSVDRIYEIVGEKPK